LMKKMALQGVIRGRRVRTTVSDKATPRPRYGRTRFGSRISPTSRRGPASSTSRSSSMPTPTASSAGACEQSMAFGNVVGMPGRSTVELSGPVIAEAWIGEMPGTLDKRRGEAGHGVEPRRAC